MGFLDDMSVLVGRGMNAADRKTQSIKLQAEIDQLVSARERALMDLGSVVYVREGKDSPYTEYIRRVSDFDVQIAGLQQQYAGLQNGGEGKAQGFVCPSCGGPVLLDSPYCTRCGDNLASLKSRYRKCSVCGVFYMADSMFCERCGRHTVELEVSRRPVRPQGVSASPSGFSPNGQTEPVAMGQMAMNDLHTLVCPSCGAALTRDSVYCGSCGKRIQ